MKKLLLLISLLFVLSACETVVGVKQLRTGLDTVQRASSSVDQLNEKIYQINNQINE